MVKYGVGIKAGILAGFIYGIVSSLIDNIIQSYFLGLGFFAITLVLPILIVLWTIITVVVGLILGIIYAVVYNKLPGGNIVKGFIISIIWMVFIILVIINHPQFGANIFILLNTILNIVLSLFFGGLLGIFWNKFNK